MSTATTRLGLTKPAGTEPQDIAVINGNMDLLDKFGGFIMVNNGVTPPNSDLFDGAIVKERTSGKVWVAQWNGSSYDKKYPYNTYVGAFKRVSGMAAVASDTTYRNIAGFDVFVDGVNASASDVGAFNWRAPFSGWFAVAITVVWPSNATGNRGLRFGSDTDMQCVTTGLSLSGVGTVCNFTGTFNAPSVGSTAGVYVWQNSGGSLAPNEVHTRIWSIAGGTL